MIPAVLLQLSSSKQPHQIHNQFLLLNAPQTLAVVMGPLQVTFYYIKDECGYRTREGL